MAQQPAPQTESLTTVLRDLVIGLGIGFVLLVTGTLGLVVATVVFLYHWHVTGQRDRLDRLIAERQRRREAGDSGSN